MRLSLSLIYLTLILSTPALSAPNPTWQDVAPSIDNIVQNRARSDFASTDSDTLSNRRLNDMMADAVSILSGDENTDYRNKLDALRKDISASQSKIANWRIQSTSAPESYASTSASVMAKIGLGTPDRGSYANMIEAEQKHIEATKASYAETETAFGTNLQKIGINLTPDEVKGLMTMATADDILSMQSAFQNMKAINKELMAATIRSDESLEVAKRYYGIYTVMLEIALHMHDDFINHVDNDYMKKLGDVAAKTEKAKSEAEALLARNSDKNLKDVLNHNISAQDLTLQAASLYRQRLADQRQRILMAREKIANQHDVAVNTYRTVQLSSDLISLMRSSGKGFDTLMSLDIPELRPFQSLEMQNEFEKLTKQLRTPVS